MGESSARCDSPYADAVRPMQAADVQSSRPVRSEPALGGGVGVGAWAPQDGGHGMAVDSVPDMAGAGADGHPHRFASSQQHRAWLRDQNSPTVRDSADGPAGGTNTGRDLPGLVSQTDDDGGDDAQHPGIPVADASEGGIGHGSASGQARKRIRGSKGRKRR